MKNTIFPPAANHPNPSHKFTRKGEKPVAAGIPVGFHPLSETMVDVLVAMQKEFVYFPDWWRRGSRMKEMAMKYYHSLRQALRRSLPSERRLTRCCQCGIFFSDPPGKPGAKGYTLSVRLSANMAT